MANVCQKCGVTGRSDCLIHCDTCKIAAEHRYCLDDMPNDDEQQVHWVCEQCKARSHKLASPSKLKRTRSARISKNKYWKIKHADIGTGKYESMESSGSNESIEQSSSSGIASALQIDQSCTGLLQKEIQNVVHSSSKYVEDEKSRKRKQQVIQGEEENIDDENNRHSSSEVIENEKSKRQHIQLNSTEDQLDGTTHYVDQKAHSESNLPANGALLSSENALDIAIKSKIQISAIDEAMNKLQNGSLEASTSQALMQIETHDTGRNISGRQKCIDHQYYEFARPVSNYVWSGYFKILNEVYGPIKAHFSDRACDKVRITAAIFPPMLQMVVLSKLDAWPRGFKNSPATSDDISLFFFPDDERAKSMLDHLIWDIINEELVLKVVLDEAELLVFPSVVLPEIYHRFQGHYFLCGVFNKWRVQKISNAPESSRSMANEIPTGEKIQDLECAEEDMYSHHQNYVVVGVAEEKKKFKALYEKSSDVVEIEKLDEEKKPEVDDPADLSDHLMIFGKNIPVPSMLSQCPADLKMNNWEEGKQTEEKQLYYELFPLQAENMGSNFTELDLELRLGLPTGDNGC